jgi:hypothetical protein
MNVFLARYCEASAMIASFPLTLLLVWLINDSDIEDHNQAVPGMPLNKNQV